MKLFKYTQYFFALFLLFTACNNRQNHVNKSELDKWLIHKSKTAITAYQDQLLNPRTVNEVGETEFVKSRDWTSGFYPGCMWYMYAISGDTIFKKEAEKRTALLEDEKFNGVTHDMGFKMYCSYGNGLRFSDDNPGYKDILLKSAKTLSTRFNSTVGCIRSWDHHAHLWQFPVIIDNMMNLELLFWAFDYTGDSTYYNMAVSHANKTMENHFREDNSSYHVVNFDTLTGKVINKQTHQGFNDESAWARGQAWGLYGFTLMYRETKDEKYLEQAKKIAALILQHPNLPEDGVPYWDFNAPGIPNEPRDASAAAIICSALYELSGYSKDSASYYLEEANRLFDTLASDKYRADENAGHHFLLEHSTGNWPKDSEIDKPIIYADYYFLESYYRKQNIVE